MWLITLEVPEKVSNKRLMDKLRGIAVPYSREGKELKVIAYFDDFDFSPYTITRKSQFTNIRIQVGSEALDETPKHFEFDILQSTWERIFTEMRNATLRKDLFK